MAVMHKFYAFPQMVGSLKMNTTLEYSTRVVQEGDRRCKKSTLNDLAYLTPLRIPLMNPVKVLHREPEYLFPNQIILGSLKRKTNKLRDT